MQIEPGRFAAFLCARLCHDLMSPATTVSLSLESLDGLGNAEEKAGSEQTLREGAERLAATLQFLRYAMGSIGLQPGTADLHQFRKLTDDYVRFQKPSLEWDLGPGELSFAHARLIMNMVMVALTALARGGLMTVRVRDEAGGKSVVITCKGDRVSLKEEIARAVRGEQPDSGWKPDNIQPYFCRMICDALGGELLAVQGPEGVVIMATGLKTDA